MHTTPKNKFLKLILDAHTINGNDNNITVQEYAVINMPASASEIEKLSAMLDKSPIGINSDVLNINAATVMPIKGSHSFFPNIFIVYLTYAEIVYTPFYLNEAKKRLNIQKIVSERKNRRYNDSVKKERGNL